MNSWIFALFCELKYITIIISLVAQIVLVLAKLSFEYTGVPRFRPRSVWSQGQQYFWLVTCPLAHRNSSQPTLTTSSP